MANKSTIIRISHARQQVNPWDVGRAAGDARLEAARIVDLFERVACGLEQCKFMVAIGSADLTKASGTVTISSGSGSITATINGVAIAVTWATSDTNTAALLAAAINASANALVAGLVTAASAAGVCTVTALHSGKQGNCITLAASGTGATASGARLTGGTGDDVASTTYDRS